MPCWCHLLSTRFKFKTAVSKCLSIKIWLFILNSLVMTCCILLPCIDKLKNHKLPDVSDKAYWLSVFQDLDINNDGKISRKELIQKLKGGKIIFSTRIAQNIIRVADADGDGAISFEEFLACVSKSNKYQIIFRKAVGSYVNALVPKRYYDEEYSCWPLPLGMIFFGVLEIITYCCQSYTADESNQPLLKELFIYNPHRRAEIWRFVTYMFLHHSISHLVANLTVQILLGIPLEMVHRWWRVILVYLAGVVAGSLGSSISDPSYHLAGASGGVYALLTAHVATIIMNWNEMRFAALQMFIFFLYALADIGSSIHLRHVAELKEGEFSISYSAHLSGAIAGLLLGINILRNLTEMPWERVIWWTAIIASILLVAATIVWHTVFPNYFPVQNV